jgi:hypothetical protein
MIGLPPGNRYRAVHAGKIFLELFGRRRYRQSVFFSAIFFAATVFTTIRIKE